MRPQSSPADTILVDLREVIYALSDALDLVGVDDIAHGKRVGIMAATCARAQGRPENEVAFCFDLGMLHDIGVSSTRTHGHLVHEFDWESAQDHCEIGYTLLRDFAPLAAMALPIRYHHTRWNQLGSLPAVDRNIAEQANLIYLVDRVDALASPYYAKNSLLLHTDMVRQQIAARADSYFSPALVAAFLAASSSEAFWLQLEPRGIQAMMQDMLLHGEPCQADIGQLQQLAQIFSRIVDAKSPFTAQHSLGVARLARLLGERLGVSRQNCDKLEIAGLLHDLGKLRVPDEILDKPGSLDDRERTIIHTHSFETYQILRHIKGFEEITLWAAYHHEEPGGSGYPFHLKGEDLPLEARILRVADIFQAMAQDRPYRPGLPAAGVLAFLNNLASEGRVDADVVAAAARDLPGAMQAALPSPLRDLP